MADQAEPAAAPKAARRIGATPVAGRRVAIRARPAVRQIILVLLALYVVKQIAFVVAFRPFTGHDEVAHYSYLRTVATEGRVPVVPHLDERRAAVESGRPTNEDRLPD